VNSKSFRLNRHDLEELVQGAKAARHENKPKAVFDETDFTRKK
jgi:hypothetical protein